jgi:ribokinase
LGVRVAFIGRVGDDARGEVLIRGLEREGVDHRHVLRDPHAPTGVALIMVDQKGRKQIMAAPGANRRLSADDVNAAAPAFLATKAVLTQLEVPVETVMQAFRLGRDAGAKTVLDPAPAVPLPDALLRLVDVIRPNASECEVLTGIQVKDRATARRAAGQLLDRGVGAAIVQAGDEGNLVVTRDEECWLPRLSVESVDATGAGDAFAAALTVCLSQGQALQEAAMFANAAAAFATTKVGAQAGLPRREDVQRLLDQTAPRRQAEDVSP